MGNEVNEVINNICEKLGYAASEITPEMAKYMIAKDIFGVLACIAIDAIYIYMAYTSFKSFRSMSDLDKMWNSELQVFSMVLAGIVCVIATIVFLITGADLVGWITSPRASMVQYILCSIR